MVPTGTYVLSTPTAAARLIRDLLEPCAGKLARTVLRGRVGGDTDLLPDTMMASKVPTSLNMQASRRYAT